MANISEYTNQIRSARYGEEVRGSIVNAIEAINDQVISDTESAGSYASDAQTAKTQTESIANDLRNTLNQLQNMSEQLNQSETTRNNQEQSRQSEEEIRQQNEIRRENAGQGYVAQAKAEADRAASYATSNYAMLSESWAVGNTGLRLGEDTNNAKYWAEQASAIATGDGVVTFNGRNGIVIPMLGDYTSNKITHGTGTVDSALESVTNSVSSTIMRVDQLDINVQNLGIDVSAMTEDFLKGENTSTYSGSAQVKTLKRKASYSDYIYPVTKASAVYTNNGEDNVENKLTSILSQLGTNTSDIASILSSIAVLPEISFEQGTNRKTFYAKFPSGLLICGIFLNHTVAVDLVWEKIFYGNPPASFGNWPLEFLDTPFFITSSSGSNVFLGGTSGVTKTAAGSAYFYAGKSQPSATYFVTIIGIGKWK